MKPHRRHLAIAAAATVLCAGFALVLAGQSTLSVFLTQVSLAMAAASAAVALFVLFKVDRMQGDIDRLARSLDGALRELAAGNARNALTLGTLTETIDRQIGGVLERIDTRVADADGDHPVAAPEGNVVPLATAPRKFPQKAGAGERLPAGWGERPLELGLEPIVSVSRGAAVAFEVYASLLLEDGSEKMVRRLSGAVDPQDLVAFERTIVKAAMHASRRQFGSEGPSLPLHVAVSAAFLGDEASVREVSGLIGIHAGLARSVVLSLPAEVFTARDAAVQRGLIQLSVAGALLACEGWPGTPDARERLQARGAGIVKLSCDRLLDRLRQRRKGPTGADLADIAHGADMTVIATGVANDEDAVALLDLGIDLMGGERFSPPRKLKAPAGEAPARALGA